MAKILSVIKSIRSTIFSPKSTMQKRISYAMVVCASFGELFGFIESYMIGLPKISYLQCSELSFVWLQLQVVSAS